MPRNALVNSTSPYLLQHASNPVRWMPWSDDVWDRAKEEGKLVIVSVGYSACHWCHVMEKETFEDDEAAAFMNAHFLSVKVDREERPDVDQVYMDAVQLMTRRGGWPLNCVALPDGRPIWGGTYFPKAQWIAGLNAVLEVWQDDPHKVEAYAQQLATAVGEMDSGLVQQKEESGPQGDDFARRVDGHVVDGLARWASSWDGVHGGAMGAPKFPLPCQLECLLRMSDLRLDTRVDKVVWPAQWHEATRAHALLTLRAMARGGLHDHVGGGFARYSVDERWHVPHFEKMLYDNGQLLGAFAEAWRRGAHPALAHAAEGIAAFMQRELDDPSGGFRSALDADSDGAEGTYYVWRTSDIAAALPEETLRREMMRLFDIDGASFWEQGQNVLMRPAPLDEALWKNQDLQDLMDGALRQMAVWRDSESSGRTKPGLDDKVLTAWTALAVTGLAKAGRLMTKREWVARAERGAVFLRDVARLPGKPHCLRRSWHAQGGPIVEGFAEDYAFTIEAMLELHQATLDNTWRREARALMATALDRFFDEGAETFWFSSREGEQLFAAKQSTDDSVLPSANATFTSCLWRLGWAEDIPTWRALAVRLIARHLLGTPSLERSTRWVQSWMDMRQPTMQVVVAAPSEDSAKNALESWWSAARPGTWVEGIWPDASNTPKWMEAKRPSPKDPVTWYVCVEGTCGLPCPTAEEAWNQCLSLQAQ